MEITIHHNTHFIFDLDDTLTDELDYVHSAFRHISKQLEPFTQRDLYPEMCALYSDNKNVFDWLLLQYEYVVPGLTMKSLLKEYRDHFPEINLRPDAESFISRIRNLNVICGLITDGRSVTQRNKIKALKLDRFFTDVIISEEFGTSKPDPANYLFFTHKYPDHDFVFFADNTIKDFVIPLQLGWKCFCLRDCGKNIHKQSFGADTRQPILISTFDEVNLKLPDPVIIN